jgi:hypothetical protein
MRLKDETKAKTIWWVLLAATLVVAAAIYSTHLTDDLYGDETGQTIKLVTQGNSLFSVVDPSTTHPPLFFLLAKASYLLVGKPWAIRLPSLVFALGIILILPFAAREILGERFFFPAAWLGMLSPFILEFSAEGRSYTMTVFLSLAALWSLVRFIQSDRPRDLVVLLVLSGLGVLTHYFFSLQIAFMGAAYLLEKRRLPSNLWKYVVAFAVPAAAAIAALILGPGAQFFDNLQGGWDRAYFSVLNFLVRLPVAMCYGFCTFRLPSLDPARNFNWSMVRDNAATILMILIAFSGFLYVWIRLWRDKIAWYRLLLLGVVIPTALALLIGKLGFYLPREKHLAIIWGCVFFLQLLGLERMFRSWPGRVAAGCHLAVMAISMFHYLAQPDEYSRRMNWTGLNETIERTVQNDDCLLYYYYDLEHLSMNRMGVLRRNIPRLRLTAPAAGGPNLETRARLLDRNIRGRIYLVDHEEGRNFVDPSSVIIRTLARLRTEHEQRFGRNLILFVFAPRSP